MARSQQVESLHGSFSRLTRFITQLTREQLSCCPITVQQSYTLEALMGGPKSMKALAAEAAFHQSTMTRIVEKLERQNRRLKLIGFLSVSEGSCADHLRRSRRRRNYRQAHPCR